MPLSTLINGESGLDAREKINAAIAAVNSTGLRASGILRAYSFAGFPATAPPALQMQFTSISSGDSFSIQMVVDGITTSFVFGTFDPGGFDYFIDSSTLNAANDYALAFVSASGVIPSISKTADDSAGTIEMTNGGGTGISFTIAGTASGFVSISGGGAGTDAVPPSGDVSSITLVPAIAGKKIRVVAAHLVGGITGDIRVKLYLNSGGDYELTNAVLANTSGNHFEFIDIDRWLNGAILGESLMAKIESGVLPSDGSLCTIGVIFDYA